MLMQRIEFITMMTGGTAKVATDDEPQSATSDQSMESTMSKE